MPQSKSPSRPATMRDLARLLGVSTSTVSRALNHHDAISEETRERIIKAAQVNHYIRNSVARGLALKRSQLVGLMVPDIGNPFFAEVARGAHDVAYDKSFVVALCDTQRSAEREELFSRTLMGSQVAGLILTGGVIPEDRLHQWKRLAVPMVLAGRKSAGLGLSGVSVDNVAVGQQATRYLVSLGHEKILFLGGPVDSPASRDRQRGYMDVMEDNGLTPAVVQGKYTMESGFQQAAMLEKSRRRITAVFAANDMMAIGLIMGLIGLGVKVPGDVSVVGCDDISMSALVKPALTTIRVPMYEIGMRAMELLLQVLKDGERGAARSILLDCELVVRESAG